MLYMVEHPGMLSCLFNKFDLKEICVGCLVVVFFIFILFCAVTQRLESVSGVFDSSDSAWEIGSSPSDTFLM